MFRILIIDPNTPFRESLRKIINGRFPTIEIQEAAAGAEGLAKLNTFTPLLIFIDIYLPDNNGLDLARKIKASYPEIIVAMFARYDSPEYRAAANDSGVRAAANDSGVEHLIPKDDWTGEDILALVESIFLDTEISRDRK
jgi:DNA-binding NarL/FixJ family response regulator